MMEKGKMEGRGGTGDTESLVPQEHLLRKVDKAVDFWKLYEIVEPLYSEEDGWPSVDPVVLIKIVLLQHLDEIPSLRGTLRRAQTDIAYRWFLGYTLNEELPHFSTVSYNFRHRFKEETIEAVFQWVLNEAGTAGALSPAAVFVDGTHIKASANLNRKNKQEVPAAAKRYRDSIGNMNLKEDFKVYADNKRIQSDHIAFIGVRDDGGPDSGWSNEPGPGRRYRRSSTGH